MTLEIVFWDVQHGSAAYIKTPGGKHIVQDLGSGSYKKSDPGFSPLLRLKEKYGIKKLDEVIITHPHKDHIDDIMNFDALCPRVINKPKNIEKTEIIKNTREEDRHIFEKYFKIERLYNTPVPPENDPNFPNNNGGVKIETFIPNLNYSNINNFSVVTVIKYENYKIILPGDNEPSSWNELLEKSEFKEAIRDADVLLASHHGRKSGFCEEIFKYFNPKLTIISDGRFCDTSATDRYSNVTQGFTVSHRKTGHNERRKCLTTRNDGVIVVKVEPSGSLNVIID